MAGSAQVLCAGIIVTDHVAAPVDHVPAAGELLLTERCFLSIGGCASNVAIDLARLGVSAEICGCVGNDAFGDFAVDYLARSGLDTAGVVRTDAAATSQTLVVNVRGEDRRFIHYIGANDLLTAQMIPTANLGQYRVLYVGGYFLMNGMQAEPLARVFREARQAGVKTMLDVVTPDRQRDYMADLEIVLPETDFFLPNEDEAACMTGERDAWAQADRFRAAGAGCVVITRGAGGAVLVSQDERLTAGTFPTEFVDGTGGGDAFDAGFLAGLLEGASLERCLTLGSALGASCVRRPSATEGVFTRPELEHFVGEHRLIVERG